MTIEEKAKAYDNVREKIAIRFGSNVADEIFSQFEMSEDERIRKELLAWLKSTDGQTLPMDRYNAAIAWLEKQGEQKPVELEKEEKSRLMKKCVHRAYQQGYDTGFFMATTELEHKQEWSEEDEAMLENIKEILTKQGFHQIQANWLKSLKDRYTWKPSDEQIRELSIVATGKGWFSKEILRELLEQLKKLRKE